MSKEIVEQDLRDYFQNEVRKKELPLEWWNSVILRATTQKIFPRRLGFWPRTRLVLALVPVALLLIGGTVYGATLVGRNYFGTIAPGVTETGLAQIYDLSQTVNGVTVKVERAYADANVVLVGFTISGPRHYYYVGGINLSTTEGQNLTGMIGLIGVPNSDLVIGDWQPSERNAGVYSFDAASIQGMPSELDLRLRIVVTDSATAKEGQNVVGSFVFDFSTSSYGGKIINVGQTVEAAGVTVDLEEIVISPWATRAVLHFSPLNDERGSRPIPVASIILPDGNSISDGTSQDKGASFSDYFKGNFVAQNGEWTLAINELVYPPPYGGQSIQHNSPSDTQRVAGPWVFHFQVS
jgi:hypothetical protein